MEENVNLSLDELEKAGGGIGGSPIPCPFIPAISAIRSVQETT